jgi:hypothetical protein
MRALSPLRLGVYACALLWCACVPSLSLENRPPPCISGYSVCPSTGFCISDEQLSADPLACQVTVRQGGSVLVPVPGGDLQTVSVPTAQELVPTLKTAGDGSVLVEVQAPHGTAIAQHHVAIVLSAGGVRYARDLVVNVSAITVSPSGGDAQDAGTPARPFRTLRRATAFAAARDTITLGNDVNGLPAEVSDGIPVRVPAGVTLLGRDVGGTQLPLPLQLLGDAAFSTLRIGPEVTIDEPHSRVTFWNAMLSAGIIVGERAVGTQLTVAGPDTEIRNDHTQHNALQVTADEAVVTISDGARVLSTMNAVQPVYLSGRGQSLSLSDTKIDSVQGTVAITVAGDAVVNLGRPGTVTTVVGKVELGPLSTATVSDTEFFPSLAVGGISFQGASLDVRRCKFTSTQGIEQDAKNSTVAVRDSTFSNYASFAYHLIHGQLDLGTDSDPGNNQFNRGDALFSGFGPFALLIDASPLFGTTPVTASHTTFDGKTPISCEVMGPDTHKQGWWEITDHVAIDFY